MIHVSAGLVLLFFSVVVKIFHLLRHFVFPSTEATLDCVTDLLPLLLLDMSIQSNVLRPIPAPSSSDKYGALRNFDVLQTFGHGHFSVVYSARNRFDGLCVALKKVEVRNPFFESAVSIKDTCGSRSSLVKSNGRCQSH